ncbi:vWA domain-containing protein [Fervidibacillus halotolerans]|uniref:VWA domain-containing protein n=1 Tax=Fervidibacillus halotolerans TaxID=2980027 RepID=A0A9E8LZN7_9BACI|nr:VWA domain-containing protein [Fervidibacillus halotolerans]WAA12352.1 VWA domain-containing protein [Fervidibacillus halotolerans]
MKQGTIKQILLITDGCSNEGEDPVAMAALAKEQGVTVNVIGVMKNDTIDEQGMKEIESIAEQGGGVSQVVYTEMLSQTVQMVTRKAMTQTLQGVVNRELKQILGSETEMEDLPPEKRGEVFEVVEELNDTVNLDVLILVDTSASMKYKLPTVKEALLDLSLSLNARTGNNRFSVFVFPGKKQFVNKLMDWTPNLDTLPSIFSKLSSGGMTPTGPAIKEALRHFTKKRSIRGLLTANGDEYFEESV